MKTTLDWDFLSYGPTRLQFDLASVLYGEQSRISSYAAIRSVSGEGRLSF